MHSVRSRFVGFVREHRGQDLVEYAILLGVVAVVVVAMVGALGGKVQSNYAKTASVVENAGGAGVGMAHGSTLTSWASKMTEPE